MSRLFGEMRQIGIVVRDIEATMQHWVAVCGVGPWFYADKLPVTVLSGFLAFRSISCLSVQASTSTGPERKLSANHLPSI